MEQRLLRSGQLAKMAGVSTDLLRHYERIGVLPAAIRAPNGYRLYPPPSAKRVCALCKHVLRLAAGTTGIRSERESRPAIHQCAHSGAANPC